MVIIKPWFIFLTLFVARANVSTQVMYFIHHVILW